MYQSTGQVNFFQASAFQGLLVVLASILHSTTQLIQGDPQTGGALQAGQALQGLVFALPTFCTFCDALRCQASAGPCDRDALLALFVLGSVLLPFL